MIYFDHNASSPPTAAHLQKLFDILTKEKPANPSSPHVLGRAASVLLSQARKNLACALNVDVGEIVFTSGGTEANNLGTRAVVEKKLQTADSVSLITTAFEHPSVLKTFEQLKKSYQNQIEIIEVQPNADGYIAARDVISNIKPNTVLISLIAANNEIGTVQPVKEIGDFLQAKRWNKTFDSAGSPSDTLAELSSVLNSEVSQKILQNLHFHLDAVQIFGKIRTPEWMSQGYDSLALSGHKLGALAGVGALVLRRGRTFWPLNTGGAQEKNRRAGTENIPGIISFGIACEEMCAGVSSRGSAVSSRGSAVSSRGSTAGSSSYWQRIDEMQTLTHFLFDELSKNPKLVLNSKKERSVPNTVHFSLLDSTQRAEDWIVNFDREGICVSSGAACSSGLNLPSHVVLSLGKNKQLATNSIRISLGFETTLADVHKFLNLIP